MRVNGAGGRGVGADQAQVHVGAVDAAVHPNHRPGWTPRLMNAAVLIHEILTTERTGPTARDRILGRRARREIDSRRGVQRPDRRIRSVAPWARPLRAAVTARLQDLGRSIAEGARGSERLSPLTGVESRRGWCDR